MPDLKDYTLSDSARERLEGAFAFFERILNDAEFREQLPDEAAVAILERSGVAFFPSGDAPARILYSPDRGEATIIEEDRAHIASTKPASELIES